MRALYLPGGRRTELREIPAPDVESGSVLIAVRAAGLCGSDLHMHYRPAPESRRGRVFGLQTDPEVVPGHEAAGEVVAVGSGAQPWRVGDRVVVHHIGGCGVCSACRRGWDINCSDKWGIYGLDRPGAMEDLMVVRARDCAQVPAEMSFAAAAYASCGAGTGYLALGRARFGLGDVVAIVGLGPVGLAAAYIAHLSGAVVVGIDPLAERRAFGVTLGLSATSDPAGARARLEELTQGRGADVVVESSGAASGRVCALEVAAVGARVACVGFGDSHNEIDLQASVIQKQLDVLGAWMFPLPDLSALLTDLAERQWSLEPLITARYTIDAGDEAWGDFDAGMAGKAVLSWEEGR